MNQKNQEETIRDTISDPPSFDGSVDTGQNNVIEPDQKNQEDLGKIMNNWRDEIRSEAKKELIREIEKWRDDVSGYATKSYFEGRKRTIDDLLKFIEKL